MTTSLLLQLELLWFSSCWEKETGYWAGAESLMEGNAGCPFGAFKLQPWPVSTSWALILTPEEENPWCNLPQSTMQQENLMSISPVADHVLAPYGTALVPTCWLDPEGSAARLASTGSQRTAFAPWSSFFDRAKVTVPLAPAWALWVPSRNPCTMFCDTAQSCLLSPYLQKVCLCGILQMDATIICVVPVARH